MATDASKDRTPPSDGHRLFRRFMEQNEIPNVFLAAVLDVDKVTVGTWRNFDAFPNAFYRRAIHVWSRGRVPESAWWASKDLAAFKRLVPFNREHLTAYRERDEVPCTLKAA